MFGIGGTELLVIFLIALLVLGPDRLPELAKYLAKLTREIRTAGDEVRRHIDPDGDLLRSTTDLSRMTRVAPVPDPIKRTPDDVELEKLLEADAKAEAEAEAAKKEDPPA